MLLKTLFSSTQAIFSRNVYTRNLIKLRRLCLGQGRAIRRADALLRHMKVLSKNSSCTVIKWLVPGDKEHPNE